MKKIIMLVFFALTVATTGLFAEDAAAPADSDPAPAQPAAKAAKHRHGKHAKHASKRHKKHHGKKTPPSAPSTAPAPEDTPAQK